MSRPLKVTHRAARRFLRRVHRLDAPCESVGEVIDRLGYVQIDPINVCGRMHDHILRNRVSDYREGGLVRHLHGKEEEAPLSPQARAAFEHHLPSTNILVAMPLAAWPHLGGRMKERTRTPSPWSGRLTPRERALAKAIFERLAAGGPVGPEAFSDDRKARRLWGAATLAKATLQKLFFHGELLIAARQANRRLYDLPDRVLPASVLSLAMPTAAETARWMALTRLRQHRLVALKRAEFAAVEDRVLPVSIEGCPTLHCLMEDAAELEDAGTDPVPSGTLLLAPLDPMIYDRRITRLLWGFDYTWEVYVPPSKRKRGYYALPVLSGCDLVGHVDLKADRAQGRLQVVSRRVRRGHSAASAVKSLAGFLGLRSA